MLSLPPLNFSVKKTHDSSPSMFTNAYCQQSFADVHIIIALATHVKEKKESRMIWRETSVGFLFLFTWFGPYSKSTNSCDAQLFWIMNISMSYIIQLKRGGLMPRVTLSRNRRPGYKGRILHIALQLATSSRKPSRTEMSADEWPMPEGHPDFLNNDPMCYVL